MRPTQYTLVLTILVSLCLLGQEASSQLGFPLQIKKSEEYEDRVLRSERSDQGKFKQPKRFIQNTVTHYNYFFNANNKLNEVLERAKTAWTDDYGKLLPFYNYTLDATARDSIQLDSIIYKASTGIALHDLRNDWVDNLYLLWGASYYLQKKFDSAYLMFQFINYAFAPKEKDGYYRTIGSSMDGNSAYSISSKEKGGLARKMLSEPPSRNDAFVWQIRNFLIQDQFAEAASLIVTLKNDPNFPKRLDNDLHEVQAFWFYKQGMWDSSANHLVEALDNATNLQEKSRWEYLVAQLYEMTGKFKEAEKYYSKVSSHTTDLVLDIYARLAAVRVNKDRNNSIEKNVEELMRMAKRDKYEEYRDIIYYMAAQMQLEGGNIEEALKLLKKSTGFASNNPNQRNKAFFQLANISYDRGDYRQAKNYYDSIQSSGLDAKETELVATRKPPLAGIVKYLDIAERQDSLQHLASLPEEERKDLVKKMVKDLRKQQGLKDEPLSKGAGPTITTPTLFPSVQPKGEWYFYNADFRSRGLNDFKGKWGNRSNVDNWRRSAAVQGSNLANNNSNTTSLTSSNTATGNGLTFEELYNNLPLKPEQFALSDDSLKAAWFELGKLYIQDIENCQKGVDVFERLRAKFAQFDKMEEVLFNLYYCYNKNGETGKAAAIKKLMNEKYPTGNLSKIVANGKDPNASLKVEATKTYETIYDLFIEGKFEQAVAMKKDADTKYGQVYWTPQLLYIEAVYYARQRDDVKAKQILQSIVSGFPKSPLMPKALALIGVLNRRDQIEKELNNLVVTRDTSSMGRPITTVTNPPVTNPPVTNPITNPVVIQPKKDTIATKPPITNVPPKKDTVAVTKPPITHASFTYDPNQPHFVGVVLNKIDPVFVNEAKNAFARYNREAYASRNMGATLVEIDKDNKLLILGPLPTGYEAVAYVDATKPKTPTEILPWLRGGKYSFIVFNDANLQTIKNSKDIDGYKTFLNLYMPGKF